MNQLAIAVIGGGYGDEGKGLVTDYHSSHVNGCMVVRYNGGAQAGHTVVTPNGKRHVHSHFGSGTLNGSPTYLSEFFIANPMLFRKEYEEFGENFYCNLFAHPDIQITTPYDMLINTVLERQRGENNHGTVGIGFGETIQRSSTEFGLALGPICRMLDNYNNKFDEYIFNQLEYIRTTYLPKRIRRSHLTDDDVNIINSQQLIIDFISDLRFMLDKIVVTDYKLLKNYNLVFEGAQGLGLDMDYGYFPHVTRSNTGMKNVSKILDSIGSKFEVTVNYVTRAYSTRHGAGPLEHEDPMLSVYNDIKEKDTTNSDDGPQGKFRLAPLDLDRYMMLTSKDFANNAPRGSRRIDTITCLDQVNSVIDYVKGGKLYSVFFDDYCDILKEKFDMMSFGPTRNDIEMIDL